MTADRRMPRPGRAIAVLLAVAVLGAAGLAARLWAADLRAVIHPLVTLQEDDVPPPDLAEHGSPIVTIPERAPPLATAAGPGPSPRGAPGPEAEARAVLGEAIATLADVASYRYALTVPEGDTAVLATLPEGQTPLPVGYEFERAAGIVRRPNAFRAEVSIEVLFFLPLTVRVIGIGERQWITDPTTEEEGFELVVGEEFETLVALINPDRLLRAALAHIQHPTVVDHEELAGEVVVVVAGTLEPAALEGLVPELVSGTPRPIRLWIGADGRVRRLELEGPLIEDDSDDVVYRLDLAGYDLPVEIPSPQGA